MEIENITKQFTRFFVPGLALIVFCIVLPYALLGSNLFFGKDGPLGVAEAILLSVLAGYVLDSIKGYRWTLALRTYNAKKAEIAQELAKHTGLVSYNNPDQHIALLWKKDEATYNRIFVERAEWVMILETSFAMLIGTLSVAGTALYSWLVGSPLHWAVWGLPLLLLLLSALSARNGIDRMTSHDLKLVEAIKALYSPDANPQEKEPNPSFQRTASGGR